MDSIDKNEIQATFGVIGGTGVYEFSDLRVVDVVYPETPWGKPSDEITIAAFEHAGKEIKTAFLPRHGKGHTLLPTELPQKANLAALKMLGVEDILSFSSVGSLKEELKPNDFVLPNQIIDRTRHRDETFFGDGIVGHVSFGDPFCAEMTRVVEDAIQKTDIPYHTKETSICMEGPPFSTRAESKLYKSWGAGTINMTVLPEAKLARELEICYQMVMMITDYDSWKESEEAVTVDDVMKVVKKNKEQADILLMEVLKIMADRGPLECPEKNSVQYAIMTAPEKRNPETAAKLKKVLPKYF